MATERAIWNYTYEKGLVDILKEHGNIPMFKGQNGWTAEGWRSITSKFNDTFLGAHFTKQQVQEKEKELKGNYKIIKEARKSGMGWNDTLGMIIAEPVVWEKLIKDNHKVAKFRKKSFPLYNNLEFLYEGSIATGDLNFTSIELPPQRTELRSEPIVQRSDLRAETIPQRSISEQSNHSNPSSFGVGADSTEIQYPPVNFPSEGQDASGGKKRKQSHIAAKLGDYIDFRKGQLEKNQGHIDEKKRREEDYSIEKCVEILDAMEGLSDEEKADANELFESETNRKVLVATKNPSVRLIWLKKKIAQLSSLSASTNGN